jgi:hypothetical protein
MKFPLPKFAVAIAASLILGQTAPAQDLNLIGVTALRAVTTNLNGSGIRVAQPEASGPSLDFEVKPGSVQLPINLFTYISAAGTDTNYPNSVGVESGHADQVAANFYGMTGIGVATNMAHVDNFDAEFFVTNYVFLLAPLPDAVAVVNQSFTFGNVSTNIPTPTNELSVYDQQQIDSAYDDYSVTNKTLFISAVNNGGSVSPPGTAYNSIGVAAYGGASSVGPTLDNGRCKPDITAPAGVTSFSTPQVAGATAVMMQAGLRGDGGSDTNSAFDLRTIKALLLNGAVKPLDWTNSCSSPLDARYGAGVLNLLNSYEQLVGGKHGPVVSGSVTTNDAHPPIGAIGSVSVLSGWDFNTNTSTSTLDRVSHYYFNVTNGTGSFIATATLVWNRQYNQANINALALFLYDCANSNLVMCSTSLVDNVQHIYTNNLSQGRYDLQVWKAGGTNTVSASETYSLAWQFVPIPTLSISGDATALTWPIYPAGFHVETATNLAVPAWSTNNLPVPTITNGVNNIQMDVTNGSQFFRLRSL